MPRVRTLTWDQVRARRLARSHLVRPAPRERLVDVVGAVCGVQAQVMSAAELAIGARVDGLTQADVRDELWERRSLVKTYGPRGTLHLLPARELAMWMAALRAIPDYHGTLWYELSGVSRDQVEELVAATSTVLSGQQLTREELAGAVSGKVGRWARERLASTWGDMLAPAAVTGALCFGPSRGRSVTFVRADEWVAGWRDEDPRSAILDVLRRFLAAYGPATPQEFARWFSTKPATAQELFTELASELVEVEVEGRRAWLLAADLDEPFDSVGTVVRLVAQYDCFVIGSRPREQLLSDAAYERIHSYRRGRFEGAVALPTLLVDGRVAGMWERRKSGRRIEITVETIDDLPPRHRKLLAADASRVGAFLGAEATLTLGTLDDL